MNPDFASPGEKAKEEEDNREMYLRVTETLKDDINLFLWTRLPGRISLDQAEDIAIKITNLINDPWLD